MLLVTTPEIIDDASTLSVTVAVTSTEAVAPSTGTGSANEGALSITLIFNH